MKAILNTVLNTSLGPTNSAWYEHNWTLKTLFWSHDISASVGWWTRFSAIHQLVFAKIMPRIRYLLDEWLYRIWFPSSLVGGFTQFQKYADHFGPFLKQGIQLKDVWNHHLAPFCLSRRLFKHCLVLLPSLAEKTKKSAKFVQEPTGANFLYTLSWRIYKTELLTKRND